MIFSLIENALDAHADKPFLIDRSVLYSYREVAANARIVAGQLQRAEIRQFLIYLEDSADLVVLLLAADIAGCRVAIVNHRYTSEEISEVANATGLQHIVVREPLKVFPGQQIDYSGLANGNIASAQQRLGSCDRGEVVILTTGTTGRSKAALYSWEALVAPVKVKQNSSAERWMLLYNLNHFAGYQVMLHVICSQATLVIPDSRQPRAVLDGIDRWEVTHLSATPTFWRMFLAYSRSGGETASSLRHITVGGEAASTQLLEQLRRSFPQATVSHIYATTELGSCFSVRDGRPGFPVSWLSAPEREVQLKIVEGELFVKSAHVMQGYLDAGNWDKGDWHPTGDLVSVKGDRVVFLGRKSEVVNVGGVKVHPLEVEKIIQEVDGVKWVRAHGQKNPVTGNLVAVDVVLNDGASQAVVEREIRNRCASSLDRYKQPRMISFLPDLATANDKILRRAVE